MRHVILETVHALLRAGRTGRMLRADGKRLAAIVAAQAELASAGPDLSEVMRLAAVRSQELTGAEGAMVNLIEGDELVVRAATGIALSVLNERQLVTATLIRFAIEKGGPLLIEDTAGDKRVNGSLSRRVQERSIICAPFFTSGGVVGSVNVVSASTAHPLCENDRETMEIVAAMLSAAIGNAVAFEAKRSEVDALSRFQTIFEGASFGIARISADGRAAAANRALEEMLGYSSAELAELPFSSYTHPKDRERELELFDQMMSSGAEGYEIEKRYLRRDGESIWAKVAASLERDSEGKPAWAITMIEDISERRRAEQALRTQAELNRHQALHDALTGLPNRTLFRDRVERSIRAVGGGAGRRVAVMMMDLDRFKEVNDSLGHHVGDALLKEIGRRLGRLLPGGNAVARLGGDEFAILLPELLERAEAARVVEHVREVVGRSVLVQGLALTVEASVGIAVYPEDGEDVESLLRHADVAMYQAKATEEGYVFYDAAADDYDRSHLTLLAELRRALASGELVLYYQPKARLSTGEVTSVEALLRWRHPSYGLLAPDGFIPFAQQSDLIRPLTLHVIDESLAQLRRWEFAGVSLSIGVNISTRNLLDLDFPSQVEALLEKWGVDCSALSLEITESTMMTDRSRTRLVLEKLAAMGMRLSIDDFGTGYCTLVHLRRLPIREIKIDRSFVTHMVDDPDDKAIVASTVGLGQSLGLDVVAEGIEDSATWAELARLGCTFGQGFYLARPMPGEDLPAWLTLHKAGLARAGAARARR